LPTLVAGAVACATISKAAISLIAPRFGHPSPEMLTLTQVLYSAH
jgi:hypothetical protein